MRRGVRLPGPPAPRTANTPTRSRPCSRTAGCDGPLTTNGRIPMLTFFGCFLGLAAFDAVCELIAGCLSDHNNAGDPMSKELQNRADEAWRMMIAANPMPPAVALDFVQQADDEHWSAEVGRDRGIPRRPRGGCRTSRGPGGAPTRTASARGCSPRSTSGTRPPPGNGCGCRSATGRATSGWPTSSAPRRRVDSRVGCARAWGEVYACRTVRALPATRSRRSSARRSRWPSNRSDPEPDRCRRPSRNTR